MARQKIWNSLPSFDMNPKRSFFGLDKTESHCFTLPKSVYDDYIRHFGLREGNLQRKIFFEINNKLYLAVVRWVRQDRTKTYKLKAGELPERDIVQFQWIKSDLTQFAIRDNMREAYDLVKRGQTTDLRIRFYHLEKDTFMIRYQEAFKG